MPKNKIGPTDGKPATALHIAVKHLDLFTNTVEPNTAAIDPTPDGRLVVDESTPIVFQMTNGAKQPLYIALFNNDERTHTRLYPPTTGPLKPVAPGQTISLGLTRQRSRQFRPILPPGAKTATEQLKAFATADRQRFEKLLRDTSSGSLAHVECHNLTTAQAQVTVVQAATGLTPAQPLQGGAPVALPASLLRIEAPIGCTGTVRLLASASSRTGKSAESTEPSALGSLSANAQPLELAATRTVGPATNAVEIELDGGVLGSISPKTPLSLHIPNGVTGVESAKENSLFAIAFDGELCHLVGRGTAENQNQSAIQIDWLPEPKQTDSALPQQRGAGRTLKLYLYKLHNWQEPTIGLHSVSVAPQNFASDVAASSAKPVHEAGSSVKHMRTAHDHQVQYWQVPQNRFQPGQRILVVVHGFTSETTPSIAQIVPMLAKYGIHYDHVLAFDYETFGTSISENGRTFAALLQEAGLSTDDGIHVDIFAHSMGTLVTRSMVEWWGGDEFVDRCFLCGPPNLGTRLAAVGELIPWLSTTMLNFSTNFPPTFLAGWVLGKMAAEGAGSRDLHPESDFLARLNSSQKRATVPYFVLAGNHQPPVDTQKSAQRPYQKPWQLQKTLEQRVGTGLDKIFADQNDLVINVQSMLGIRNSHYPADLLHTKIVQCNHFGYFATDECHGQLAQWLQLP